MRITRKGQVTIPWQIRHELGLESGDEVEIVSMEGRPASFPCAGPPGGNGGWATLCSGGVTATRPPTRS